MKVGRILHLFAYLAILRACIDRKHDGKPLLEDTQTEESDESNEQSAGTPAPICGGTANHQEVHGHRVLLSSGGRPLVQDVDQDTVFRVVWNLWTADTNNRAVPYQDFDPHWDKPIYQQLKEPGYVPYGKLFDWVNEEKLFNKPTYKALWEVFEAYDTDDANLLNKTKLAFFAEVTKTEPYKVLKQFLIEKGCTIARSDAAFNRAMLTLWMEDYEVWIRGEFVKFAKAFFEHYFIGQTEKDKPGILNGLHNWWRIFFLQLNYSLYYIGTKHMNNQVLPVIQFWAWNDIRESNWVWKEQVSVLMGASPEFEIALISFAYFTSRKQENTRFFLGERMAIFIKAMGWNWNGKSFLASGYLSTFDPDKEPRVVCPTYIPERSIRPPIWQPTGQSTWQPTRPPTRPEPPSGPPARPKTGPKAGPKTRPQNRPRW